jgi:polyhydroxyalkanoate synthesis regulator phasin
MPVDVEQLVRDQINKLQSKLQEMAREALHDELSKLHGEISDLRARVAKLEAERAEKAAESLESSF